MEFGATGVYISLFIFIVLLISSEVLSSFVLYGRTTKQLIPFLCIACSCSLSKVVLHLWSKKRFVILFSFSLILLLITSSNQLRVLKIIYPQNFKEKASLFTDDYQELSSIHGIKVKKLEKPSKQKNYTLVNAQLLVPPLDSIKNIPEGDVLLACPHPYYFFKPYQFLHYNREQRSLINSQKLSMKLIKRNEEY